MKQKIDINIKILRLQISNWRQEQSSSYSLVTTSALLLFFRERGARHRRWKDSCLPRNRRNGFRADVKHRPRRSRGVRDGVSHRRRCMIRSRRIIQMGLL
ncbi:hypothetical protein RND81_10G003100 [Saponaria officinalis]|uniref:Uncharacterized protein n=1 Tax=Saponaria officinalis TaxID=3572 RepID=A0AAW1HX20_SAPOF